METFHDLWPQTAPLRTLEDLIEEHAEKLALNGGDLEAIPEIAALLAFDEEKFYEQLETLALKAMALRADGEAAKIERVRLQEKEARWLKGFESIKGYVLRQMQSRRVAKHKTPRVSLSVVRNSRASVSCKSEALLEELFNAGSPLIEKKIVYAVKSDDCIAAAEKDEERRQAEREILAANGTIVEMRKAIAQKVLEDHPSLPIDEAEKLVDEELQRQVSERVEASFSHDLPEGIQVARGYHVRIS